MKRPTSDRPDVIQRAATAAVDDVDKSSKTVVAIVTTDSIDRMYEVILPRGIALANFQANPVVLWGHNSRLPPIGKCLWIKRKGNGLIAKTKFAPNDEAQAIFDLYADEFLRAWSIGARPDWSTYSAPTAEEIKARPELKTCYAMIRKCELVEYSAVGIPANPDCLATEVGKSLKPTIRDEIERARGHYQVGPADADDRAEDHPTAEIERAGTETKPELPPLVGLTLAQVIEARRGAIRSMTGADAIRQALAEQTDRLKGRI